MSKLKQPVPLNAVIYNNLVKIFNDASNGIVEGFKHKFSPEVRNKIIELRKQFPTYQELKDSGIMFVDSPIYLNIDSNGNHSAVEIKSWVGNIDPPSQVFESADIHDAKIVYTISFVLFSNPKTFQHDVALKVRGIPKTLTETE